MSGVPGRGVRRLKKASRLDTGRTRWCAGSFAGVLVKPRMKLRKRTRGGPVRAAGRGIGDAVVMLLDAVELMGLTSQCRGLVEAAGLLASFTYSSSRMDLKV